MLLDVRVHLRIFERYADPVLDRPRTRSGRAISFLRRGGGDCFAILSVESSMEWVLCWLNCQLLDF